MIDLIKEFIEGIIAKLDIECEVSVTETDDAYEVQLTGKDANVLIGYRGDVLDSLQYLTLLLINKDSDNKKRLVIDGENYRAKREATLAKLAKNLAFKVSKSGQELKLEPMNPFERRIIHAALANDTYVTTESEGVEPNRYIVIKPTHVRHNNNNRPHDQQRKPQQPKPAENTTNTSTSIGSRNFNKYGSGSMKSFGGEKRRFF